MIAAIVEEAQGTQDATAESIKSLEGFRLAWIEERRPRRSLPAPTFFAEGLGQNGGLGGGDTAVVNISVINANSVVNLFQRNERISGQVVVKYARRNPARVPKLAG